MYRLLSAFLPFIKELFFERKEEMDFSNYKFNVKKWLQYVLFLGLIVTTIFSGTRLFALTSKMIDVKKKYQTLEEVEKKDTEIIKSLQDKLDDMQEQNHQLQLRCLVGNHVLPVKPPKPVRVKKPDPSK